MQEKEKGKGITYCFQLSNFLQSTVIPSSSRGRRGGRAGGLIDGQPVPLLSTEARAAERAYASRIIPPIAHRTLRWLPPGGDRIESSLSGCTRLVWARHERVKSYIDKPYLRGDDARAHQHTLFKTDIAHRTTPPSEIPGSQNAAAQSKDGSLLRQEGSYG